jgi:hypothetical protein
VWVQFIVYGEAGEIDIDNSSSIIQDVSSNRKCNNFTAKQNNKVKALKCMLQILMLSYEFSIVLRSKNKARKKKASFYHS